MLWLCIAAVIFIYWQSFNTGKYHLMFREMFRIYILFHNFDVNSCSTIEITLSIPMHFCINNFALLICCFIRNINNPLRNDHDADQTKRIYRVVWFVFVYSQIHRLPSHSINKRSFILSLLSIRLECQSVVQ